MDFIFIFQLIVSCNFLSTSFPDRLSFLLEVRTKKLLFQNALFEISLINPEISLINPEISLNNSEITSLSPSWISSFLSAFARKSCSLDSVCSYGIVYLAAKCSLVSVITAPNLATSDESAMNLAAHDTIFKGFLTRLQQLWP